MKSPHSISKTSHPSSFPYSSSPAQVVNELSSTSLVFIPLSLRPRTLYSASALASTSATAPIGICSASLTISRLCPLTVRLYYLLSG